MTTPANCQSRLFTAAAAVECHQRGGNLQPRQQRVPVERLMTFALAAQSSQSSAVDCLARHLGDHKSVRWPIRQFDHPRYRRGGCTVRMLATGCRIGELLALRWGDVALDSAPPRATITGTVVQTSAGLDRQDMTKTEAGHRSIGLPAFAVEILERLHRDASRPSGKEPSATAPVLASQTGGWRSPNNVNRQWREARGKEFDWVTWHIFRKTALTAIDERYGLDAVQAHAGHSMKDTVTRKHYVRRAIEAPDVRAALEPLGDRGNPVTES